MKSPRMFVFTGFIVAALIVTMIYLNHSQRVQVVALDPKNEVPVALTADNPASAKNTSTLPIDPFKAFVATAPVEAAVAELQENSTSFPPPVSEEVLAKIAQLNRLASVQLDELLARDTAGHGDNRRAVATGSAKAAIKESNGKSLNPSNEVTQADAGELLPAEYADLAFDTKPEAPTEKSHQPPKINDEKSHFSNAPEGQIAYVAGARNFVFRDLHSRRTEDFEADTSRLFVGAEFNQPLNNGFIIDGQLRVNYEWRNQWSDNLSDHGPYIELRKLRVIGESLFDSPWWSFELGRKRLRSERSWLYDDDMEFVSLHYESTLLDIEFGAATWLWDGLIGISPPLFEDGQRIEASGTDYLFAKVQYQWQKGNFLQLDFLHEDFINPLEVPTGLVSRNNALVREADTSWFSFSAYGSADRGNHMDRYWFDAALAFGERSELILKDQVVDAISEHDIKAAYGIQFGLLRQWNNWGVGVTAGLSGTGDKLSDKNNFVQPVISQNRERLFSKAPRRYFGELLAPYLDGLQILSLHGAARVAEDLWLEASIHKYWQQLPAAQRLQSRTSIPADLSQSELGTGFELLLSGGVAHNTQLQLQVSVLQPDSSWDVNAFNDSAWRVQFQIQRRW